MLSPKRLLKLSIWSGVPKVPIGIPIQLPSFLTWSHVIGRSLQKFLGPPLMVTPLTEFEKKCAEGNIMKRVNVSFPADVDEAKACHRAAKKNLASPINKGFMAQASRALAKPLGLDTSCLVEIELEPSKKQKTAYRLEFDIFVDSCLE